MIDIRLIRENPELVRENIRKKFQDAKLPLVDEVIAARQGQPRRHQRGVESARRAQHPVEADRHAHGTGEKRPVQARRGRGCQGAGHRAGRRGSTELEQQEAELEAKIAQDHAHHPADHRPERAASARMTAATLRCSALATPSCRISRSRTTRRSWSALTALISTPRAASPATVFTICMGDIARLHEAVLTYARDFMIDQRLHLLSSRRS